MAKGSGGEAAAARADENKRQAKIRQGTRQINKTFRQFDGDFYGDASKNYVDYATPQLEDQYEDAGEELAYDMARRGLDASSVNAEKTADLSKLYELNRQDVVDKGREYGTKIKNDVQDAKTDLITTLTATGDKEGAASSALARASALSEAPAYSPLTALFADFTNALGTQAGLERAYASGSSNRPRYNLGLYGSGSSVKVS